MKQADAITEAVWNAANDLIAELQGDAGVLERLVGGSVLADCLRRMSVEERGALFSRCAAYMQGRKEGRASMRKGSRKA